MNLLLLTPSDLTEPGKAVISGRRFEHLKKVLKSGEGDTVKAGLLNDQIGHASITSLSDGEATLSYTLSQPAPEPLPLILVVALPRPQMLKRIIETATTLGVKQLHLINSNRVEKSYWQTPSLAEDKVLEYRLLGLEQAVDTRMPEIHFHKRFRPFVEDTLPQLCHQRLSIVAHPRSKEVCPIDCQQPALLVIGPEGGFIDYEIEKLMEAGCKGVTIGSRILKVETAVSVLTSRLFPGA